MAGLLGGVLGAGIGALGSTAGAWLTSRRAIEQARIQADTELASARLAVNVEHRRTVYAEFAAALDLFHDLIDPAWWTGFDADSVPQEAETLATDVADQARAVSRTYSRVAIAGPEPVAAAAILPLERASRIRRAIAEDARILAGRQPGTLTAPHEATAMIRDFNHALDIYLDTARTAVDPNPH